MMNQSRTIFLVLLLCLVILISLNISLVSAASPTAPVITPLAPETYATSVTISWTAATSSAGIDRYYIQRSTSSRFVVDATITDVGNNLSYTFNGLLYNNTYYFRVYAKSKDGNPANQDPWDPVTNPNGIRWSAITRTACIPAPTSALAPPVISMISPGVYNSSENTFYSDSPNPTFTLATPGTWPTPTPGTTFTKIFTRGNFSIGVKSDGTLWSWGRNNYGQLGNGTNTDCNIPQIVKVNGAALNNITTIAGGWYHAIIIKTDGTVWTWGNNEKGQLGDGTTTNRSTPVQVKLSSGTPLTNIIAIGGGYYNSVALKSDGTVWAWGYNQYGQLGIGTNGYGTDQKNPVQVRLNSSSFLTNIIAISIFDSHTIALKSDKTVWTWGTNDYGELGNGTGGSGTYQNYPVQVKINSSTNLSNILGISAGDGHSLALKDDGTVWAWGLNNGGQLGNGTSGTGTDQKYAVQVIQTDGPLTNVKDVKAGNFHSIALKTDGTVWTWGLNMDGELGYGIMTNQNKANQMILQDGIVISNPKEIVGGSNNTLILTNDGKILAFGVNQSGQLGDGTRLTRIYPSKTMTDLYGIATGGFFCARLKNDGTVWAWGDNFYKQLGDGDPEYRSTPGQIKLSDGNALTGIISIACGNSHTIALKNDGTVWTWGYNSYGQLGNGTTSSQKYPIQVKLSNGSILTNITKIEAGSTHSIALKGDGTVWTWGYNYNGQLGNGTNTDQTTPVQVKLADGTFLKNVVAISGGSEHTIALTMQGSVWAWGSNYYGQLGNGTNTDQKNPVQVKLTNGNSLYPINAISAGGYHSIALKSDGTVWTWGANSEGQLGYGAIPNQKNPVQVRLVDGTPLKGITDIVGGMDHSIALKSDGTVWTWGKNSDGQLGNGTRDAQKNPVQVKLSNGNILSNIIAISGGSCHTIALTDNNSLWTWGNNEYGQLCNGISGVNKNQLSPVKALTGSRLNIMEYCDQPKSFTEYPPIPLDFDQTSVSTNWNLPDGKYITHVGIEVNDTVVWSSGSMLKIVPPSPIKVAQITGESKIINGNPQYQISVSFTPVSGVTGYKFYRRKNDGPAECLTPDGITATSFIDTNLSAHDGLYEYGYSTYRDPAIESEIKWGDNETIVTPNKKAPKVFVPNLEPHPIANGPRSVVINKEATFNLHEARDQENDQLEYRLYIRKKATETWTVKSMIPTSDNQTIAVNNLEDKTDYEWYLSCIEADSTIIDRNEIIVVPINSLYIDTQYLLPLCSNAFEQDVYDNVWGTKDQLLTFRAECNPLANFQTYEWNFGDGSPVEPGKQTNHTYHNLGNYTIVVTATDTLNTQYKGTVSIKIINTPKGQLYANETWTVSHTIEGDVMVPAGIKLTIEPNTQIKVNPNAALLISGELQVSSGANFDWANGLLWKGICFNGTGVGTIDGATISHALRGVACIGSGQITIQNSNLSNNNTGIHCYSGNISILGCNILNNSVYGIKEDNNCQPLTQNCIFRENGIPYYDSQLYDISIGQLNTTPNTGNQFQ